MSDIDIRLTTPADMDAMAALYAEAFDPIQPRMSVEQYLTPPGAFALVAHLNSTHANHENTGTAASVAAGFLIGRVASDETEIFSVGVANEFRRRGVGRALVETLCALAAAKGAKSVFLEVAADNPGAEALYRGLGFQVVGRRKDYYRDPGGARVDAIVMQYGLINKGLG
ncbi:MAG: GNAT family N-acetyltransferase [Rhodospirillaceae bacterium]|jgi:ribosomal-protein-alanine N-acetyltransferase|nr:GNAT family N-acetyltransferase [Rhodospirillaceae bacterium]MBT5667724.1 GNAT family N-acetyltransferase [Rhodospirillaceae bacterium]MBT5811437.1 GNAT family N-acetyltransferase [Rhodospirillaceae bacterium]